MDDAAVFRLLSSNKSHKCVEIKAVVYREEVWAAQTRTKFCSVRGGEH